MKKIAVGDLGEFWYGDYKEPFEQLEGGVPGHPVGVVLKADDGKLLCAWCGKTFDNLGRHVSTTHHTPAAMYKREIGLLQKSSLVSERRRLTLVAEATRRRFHEASPANWRSLAYSKTKRPTGQQGGQWVPERLNQTGRCRKQVLALASALAREGRLTPNHMARRGVKERTWSVYWRSFTELIREVGVVNANRHQRRRYTDGQLTRMLWSLAQSLGRTPSRSDLRRYGLPCDSVWRDRFGTYSAACERAGLQPNLPMPDGTETDITLLVAYATTGNVDTAGRAVGVTASRVSACLTRYGAPLPQRLGHGGQDTSARKAWAAEMARRLAGVEDQAA